MSQANSIKKNPYILHTSVSGFNLLFLSAILNKKTYGAVDYRILYEKGVSLWYLTKTGYKQTYNLSKNLTNDKFFAKIISDSEKLNNSLKLYKTPKLSEKNVLKEWKRYLEILNKFCRIYRFYEQPFQQSLEEMVLRYISEDQLIKKLSNLDEQSLEKINNSDSKDALDKLIKLGRMKLKLHHNAESLVIIDLMNFINFVAKKNSLSIDIIGSLTVNEFTHVLQGKHPNINLVKERLNGCAIVKKNNKWYFDSGNKYLYWKNKIKSTQDKEISGKVAYPGKAKGRVVVHQSWTDTTKLSKGEILVTGMTNPQMIPFIKEAAAIVTDEGGITCHAAIISREMKKPCITGTKNATQILKDGDLIEVDANKGIVKIIKN